MRHISLLRCTVFLFFFVFSLPILLQTEALAQNVTSQRAVCGGYSFIVPEGYSFRMVQTEAVAFSDELILNDPYIESESEAATIICLRERKTEFTEYVLTAKQDVKLRTSPKQTASLVIMAAEDVIRAGLNFRFSILEEKAGNRREIRGIHYYVPVIEINARGEEYHTLLFIKDCRKNGDYYNMEGYTSAVNRIADRVLRSIKRVPF